MMYIGGGGAGNFVKMVHNGIEYGDMQLISEVGGESLLGSRGRCEASAGNCRAVGISILHFAPALTLPAGRTMLIA